MIEVAVGNPPRVMLEVPVRVGNISRDPIDGLFGVERGPLFVNLFLHCIGTGSPALQPGRRAGSVGRSMSREKCPATILVVDDKKIVRDGVVRYCTLHFDRVLSAATPDEAENHLERERPPYLLCDYWLGPHCPTAVELIPRWRRTYSCLRCVALMTGTNALALEGVTGVDEVFQKPLKLLEVVDFFIAHHAAS